MQSLADQTLAQMGGRSSVLARQRRDHIELARLLERLTKLQPKAQQRVLLRIYRLVFPHAFAEESVLWPLIRRLLPDGEQLTLKVELEHQAINELATRLDGLNPRSAERQQVLDRIITLLRQDVRDEEDQLLPRLQSKLSRPQLHLLGVAWEAVRRTAPTRAHPIVARRPPGNVLAALPLSVLDRARDRVDGALYRGPAAAPRPLRGLSSALAQAARVVEQLPGLQSGEDAATRVRRVAPGRWIAAAVIAATAASALVVVATRRRRRVVTDKAQHSTGLSQPGGSSPPAAAAAAL